MLPFILGAIGMMAGAAFENNSFAPNAVDNEPEQYTVKQVADKLNVSELTIKRRIKKGELKADIVDGKYIISRNELRRFIDTFPTFGQKENSSQIKMFEPEVISTLKDKLEGDPEMCRDFIKRCELSEKEIDVKLQTIDLDQKIYKDDAQMLENLAKKKYDYGFIKVQLVNNIRTLNYILDNAKKR